MMIGIICFSVLIIIIASLSRKRIKPTGNKRIVEVETDSGKKTYRCEQEVEDGKWHTMTKTISVGPYGESYSYIDAIFNSKDEALRFIGQHPDQIVKSEKVIKENEL